MEKDIIEKDILDEKDFYEVMYRYRTSPISEQKFTIEAFEEVKEFIRLYFDIKR